MYAVAQLELVVDPDGETDVKYDLYLYDLPDEI